MHRLLYQYVYLHLYLYLHNLPLITALTCDRSADQSHKREQGRLLRKDAAPGYSRDTSDQFFDIYFLGNLFACH